jgi:ribose transport system ATP-binding protein
MLELENVSGGAAADVTLRVASGEIVGIAGLLGSGRSSLLHSIFGAVPRAGAVRVDGVLLRPHSIDDAMKSGVALVPENRSVEAAFIDLDVGSNLSVASLRSYWNGLRLNRRKEEADSEELASRYAVKAPSLSVPLGTLSGGNQQKVIVARWLRRNPRVLLLDEPTQGVDVGARSEIHDLVRSAAEDGAAVLVVSSDFEELVELVDRAVVIAGGRIVDELAGDEMTDDRLAQLVHSDLAAA